MGRRIAAVMLTALMLGDGRWAIHYIYDSPAYAERTAIIHPDGSVTGAGTDSASTASPSKRIACCTPRSWCRASTAR